MNPESTTKASIEETTPNSPPLPVRPIRAGYLGGGDNYTNIGVPLYNALMSGDWEAARVILDEHQDLDLLGSAITGNDDTALHVAASAESSKLRDKFVKELVTKMTTEQLILQNRKDDTALSVAAAGVGNVNIAMTMVEKNRALLYIPNNEGLLPISIASLYGQSEMVNYLYDNSNKMTGSIWRRGNGKRDWVFNTCVDTGLFDVALKMVADWPEIGDTRSVLVCLAKKKDAFGLLNPPSLWRAIRQFFVVNRMKIELAEKPSAAMQLLRIILRNSMKPSRYTIEDILATTRVQDFGRPSLLPIFVAAEMGNVEFVVEVIRQLPDLLWKRNDNNQTIFHVAVLHRHEGIYNLLHEIGSKKDMITSLVDKEKGNNILHLAGKMAKENEFEESSGVGLQMRHMQRQVLWFKEVQNMVPPSCREMKNNDGLTPHQLFEKEHQHLLSDNEKWMKDTANQCLVVAALVASIGFAATFAVPGGYDQNNGIPIFLHNRSFIVFAISDAISLAFSSMSILIFLSIFISRYAENDFLESLPKKLMKGLAALFFSITAMLVGFGVSFFTFFQDKLIWVPIIISMLISLPIILYARLQYYLLMDVYQSTYGSRNLFKPKKPRLYHLNPRL